MPGLVRLFRYYTLLGARRLWDTKGVWLRASLCLFLGIGILFLEDFQSFDGRFQLRGEQQIDQNIVLINIGVTEWADFIGVTPGNRKALGEFTPLNDQYFWSPPHLTDLLQKVQLAQPKAIGVTFFFQKTRTPFLPAEPLIQPNIIWGARLNLQKQPISPALAQDYSGNAGILDFTFDNDKAVRRFSQPYSSIPHMAIKLAQFSDSWTFYEDSLYPMPGVFKTINYRGGKGTFPSYTLKEVMSGEADGDLDGKIVIIGSGDLESHLLNTPMGAMTRAEVTANVVDNFLNKRWFRYPSKLLLAVYLVLILALTVWLLFSYPQSVAFVLLIWIGLGIGALSLWIFDLYYYWLPLMAPLTMMSFTYILFLGYQITQKDNINWRLQQEQRYTFEVEQLKHNFVSLISHDLKTPIAKIQAICDRLMAKTELDPEVAEGLKNLRRENTELNRYIQSILKVSRVESRDFRISKEAADINEIVFKVMEQLRPLAQNKSQTLNTNLEPMFSVELDSVLIQEVILNLVENAIKYTPEGGEITVSSKEIDDKVIFSVRDNGPGVSSEDKKKIFSKFYRVNANEAKQKGSGIGLYLVKYFIELHGGRVFVESELGCGAKIGFTLPVMDESIAPSKEAALGGSLS
jgi:two-component system phosphate regulon sensor histidine kinase PhoR